VVDPDRPRHHASVALDATAAKVVTNITLYGDIQAGRSTEYQSEMPAAELHILDENELIEAWRAEALERAGYPAQPAAELAARQDIDLHQAMDLLGAGCSVELALRILL
jgi:hypothetical protein